MSMTLSGDGSITGLVAGGLPDASVVDADLSLAANSAPIKTALNASGSAPIYACRAWVNFNGTGTVAIRASGNVSSITDNGTGDYTVNFTTAMTDADYCALASVSNLTGPNFKYIDINNNNALATTTACRLIVLSLSNVVADEAYIYFSLFR
jgi:hypothetical protein